MSLTADDFKARIDSGRLMRDAEALWHHERGQTIECYYASARHAEKLLRDAGLDDVERIGFPADGETVYQDKTSPLAWSATAGRLELLRPVAGLADPVVADFQRHPFHLIRGSVATPEGGIETQLVNEDDAFLGIDIRGKMVLLNPESRPAFAKYREFSEMGALGIVSDNLKSRYVTPHGIQWGTGFNEGPSWHPRADTRPMIGFSISPITGDRLRESMRSSSLPIRVHSDGRLFPDTVDVVTAVIPGESTTEIWLLAHLYEPLPDDNSTGVAAAVEIARVIRGIFKTKGITPRHTLRLVFGHEMYGFAAYAASRGGFLGDQVLCAVNLDAMPATGGFKATIQLSQPGSVSCAEFALQQLANSHPFPNPEISEIRTENSYGDDMILADPTIGIPTFWLRGAEDKGSDPCTCRLWHCSEQSMERIDADCLTHAVALLGTWAARIQESDHAFIDALLKEATSIVSQRLRKEHKRLASLTSNDAASPDDRPQWRGLEDFPKYRLELESRKLKDFHRYGVSRGRIDAALAALQAEFDSIDWGRAAQPRPTPDNDDEQTASRTWSVAARIIPTDRVVGFPYDLAAVPLEKRRSVLGSLTYGPLASIFANTNGQRNLAELIERAQWEAGRCFPATDVDRILSDVQYLSRCGYIDLSHPVFVADNHIHSALKTTGIVPGDCVFLHSGMTALGPVDGGPASVLGAVLDYLGPKGTLLMPTFTRSFFAFNGIPIRSRGFRPYNPKTTPVWTGSVAATFARMPGVIRTPHPTHSVTGIGPLAQQCLAHHKESDPPTGATSAFAHLHSLKAKIAWLGADLSSCTYLHFLEDEANLPYLKPATCMVEDDDGSRRSIVIPKHLSGPRNFYHRPAEETKTFVALFAKGLKMTSAPVGFSHLKVIAADQLHTVGKQALSENPNLFL